MCGLCGELRLDGRSADMAAIQAMTKKLEPRGPDHEGLFSDGALGFGHRRLSVIDLSEHANQPMVDQELRLVLVFNGAIYNYKELRSELQGLGYHFFSHGDSEVILKAWHAWGEKCVERLHGMFAFAIWDERKKSLFLARDRLGIKPLYYSLDDQRIRFASNMQALLAGGGIDKSIDPIALHHQFTLHAVIPAPRTILQGIRKLSPSHTMTIDHQGVGEQKRYWSFPATRFDDPLSDREWVDAVHESLRKAVAKRNDVADVPVGVLLSGGLDSSLLVALLAETGLSDLRTFSVGFEDAQEESGNEFEFSDQIAKRYNTRHHKFLVPNSEVLKRLPEAVDAMAEPMFGQDAVAFYLLSEQVSKEIKVVQSGQGADEVFAGYFWYPRMMADNKGTPTERFARHYFDRDHSEFQQMIQPAFASGDHTSKLIGQLLSEPYADTFLDAVLRMDVTTLITDDPVKRVDNMTMAWGLEARVPFLDHELVELAARCPPEVKLKGGGKYLLKEISRGIVPDSVIDRPKAYFPMPALKYVRGDFLAFMRDIVTSDACRQRGIYQPAYIDMLLSAPEMHHTRLKGSKLWHLALLEFWLQRQVDAA